MENYTITSTTTGVELTAKSLFNASRLAGCTAAFDVENKAILDELIGWENYNKMEDQSKFEVEYNGFIIKRVKDLYAEVSKEVFVNEPEIIEVEEEEESKLTYLLAVNKVTGEELKFKNLDTAAEAGYGKGAIKWCLKGKQSSHKGFKWSEVEFVKKEVEAQISGKLKLSLYKIDKQYISDAGKIKLYIKIASDGEITATLALNSSIEVGVGKIFAEQEAVESEWSCYIKLEKIDDRFVSASGTMMTFVGFRWFTDDTTDPSMLFTQIIPKEYLAENKNSKLGLGSCRTYIGSKFKQMIRDSKK